MNKNKFKLFIVLAVMTLFIPFGVFAKDINPDDLIKQVVPDGKNLAFKGIIPENEYQAMDIMKAVSSRMTTPGYNADGWCDAEDFTKCTISISADDGSWFQDYPITVTYTEPTDEELEKYGPIIQAFLDEFETNFADDTSFFLVEDMSLINYYMTSDYSELWNPGAANRALKFSTVNNATYGADVDYELGIGLGEQDPALMYESAGGSMLVYYNGTAYASTFAGVYLKRVIYIPASTADTTDAYIAAAKKRIKDYLGNNNIEITLGGALTTLADNLDENSPYYESSYQELLDENVNIEETDGNYYNVKIGNRTYKFYIIKTDAIPDNPVYIGSNIDSQIVVGSEDPTVPLDTTVIVKKVDDNTIKTKIGTDNYVSYDINLFSVAKGTDIKKLDNGKFLVGIPVPANLVGKTLTVYYIPLDGEIEEHEANVEKVDSGDYYAYFETDHFSTYTLAEKVDLPTVEPVASKEEVPKTLDSVSTYVSLLVVSVLGIGATIKLAKKNY